MGDLLNTIASAIAESPLRGIVIQGLREIPGAPPLVQSIHILAIGVVVATVVMVHLRILGVAAGGQDLTEMIRRCRPWLLGALVALVLSGAVFVIARPDRYFANPLFGIKFMFMIPALALAFGIQQRYLRNPETGPWLKVSSAVAVLLWIGVILAGRWIAYVDYLFWEA